MELLALIAFLASAIAVVFTVGRRREVLVREWSAYATRHRYAFAEGDAHERAFRIEGSRGGMTFFLEARHTDRVVTRLGTVLRPSVAGRIVGALGG